MRLRPADNPFAAHRIDDLDFRPQTTSWDELLARLARLSNRAAIVGPEGAGKTTLLEQLSGRLEEPSHLVHLGSRRQPLAIALAAADAAAAHHEVLLVDAAESLGPLAWWRLRARARRAAGLVVTLHRPGRLPTLVTCRTSPALLAELVAELAPAGGWASDIDLAEVWCRHRGDLRRCLRELYHHAGQQPT